MSTLDGTVALITGASSGIGAATAKRLAAEGAAVALVARRGDRLEALADDIRNTGGHALAIEADITDRDQAVAAIDGAVAHLGRLDTLVNNAGLMLLGPMVDAPIEEWDRMLDLNVRALLSMTHAAMPRLVEGAATSPRGIADIVNISSSAGRIVRNGSGVYAATKFGVGALSESLRQEVAKRHVRVGLIEPGATESELRDHIRPEVGWSKGDFTWLAAEDVADAIAYMVTRPWHAAINELLIRPTEQDR